jgi:hypothetical protein
MERGHENVTSAPSIESPKTIFAWLRIWLFEQAQCQQLLLQSDSSNKEERL